MWWLILFFLSLLILFGIWVITPSRRQPVIPYVNDGFFGDPFTEAAVMIWLDILKNMVSNLAMNKFLFLKW